MLITETTKAGFTTRQLHPYLEAQAFFKMYIQLPNYK